MEDRPKIKYEYNPHLPPQLRFGTADTDKLPESCCKLRNGAR